MKHDTKGNNMKLLTQKTMLAGLAASLLMLAYPAGKAAAAAPSAPMMFGNPMFGYQGANLDFDLVNRTGYQIKAVLVSPSSQSEWSYDNDVIKGRRFNDGTKLHITFNHHAHAEHWDLKVVYDDNSSKEWDHLNLDKISKVTLWYDHKTDKTRAEIE